MINTKFEDIFKSIYDGSPDSLEKALLRIKELGATQMQSAFVLIKELKLSIEDADYLIVNSSVWKENKEIIVQIRREIGDFLEDDTES